MKVSTRSRYGLRIVLSLAESYEKRKVLLKELANKQNLSEKYLSLLMINLTKRGIVKSTRGSIGGYSLAKPPAEISAFDVLDTLEGNFTFIDCVDCPEACERVNGCKSRMFWNDITDILHEKMKSLSIQDLIDKKV